MTAVNASQILALNPKVGNDVASQLAQALTLVQEQAQINTRRRLRYFVAQVYHETQAFTKWTENMYYTTPERLVENWPARFTMDQSNKNLAYAPDYLRNDVKLANLVYANRYGNGGPESGDGSNFRGRGGFHLTFRDNYRLCSTELYGDQRLVAAPELVAKIDVGIQTAGWFWNNKKLSPLTDADEFTQVTKVISGSTATAKIRLGVLSQVQQVF